MSGTRPGQFRRVHFICTGNICRSPLAAALFRMLTARRGLGAIEVESAGLYAVVGAMAAADMRELARRQGLELDAHRGRAFEPERVGPEDLVVVMERVQRRLILEQAGLPPEQVVLLGEFDPRGPLDVDDPYGGSSADYARCATRLERCVEGLIDWLQAGRA